MRMRYRLTLAGMVLVLGTALPLAAQDTTGQQDVFERLQGKTVLSDADTTAFRLGQRVGGATGDGFSGEIAYLRFFTGLATEAQALEMYLNMWDSRPVEYAPAGTTYPESAADILDLGDSASPSFGGTVKISR